MIRGHPTQRGLDTKRVFADQGTARMSNVTSLPKRRAVIVGIMIVIAAIHMLRVGSYLHGEQHNFYYSYFSDLVLPFGCYFLLSAAEHRIPVLRHRGAKVLIAFVIPSIAETCQYFGIPVLGSTFDLLDYLMYGVGTVGAAVVDAQVFSRVFVFWILEKAER